MKKKASLPIFETINIRKDTILGMWVAEVVYQVKLYSYVATTEIQAVRGLMFVLERQVTEFTQQHCKHNWSQEYYFMSESWFECTKCGKKEYWCGTYAHRSPNDCKKLDKAKQTN